MGTKFSRWRPPNNRIFEKDTIFFRHPVYPIKINGQKLKPLEKIRAATDYHLNQELKFLYVKK